MPAQKPQPNRAPNPYVVQARVSKAQYAHLLVRAEAAGSVGAALREILDESIDTTTVYNEGVPEDHPGAVAGGGGLWRSLMNGVDLEALDPDELAQLLRDE